MSAEPSSANAHEAVAPKVFINYRHEDTEEAAVRIYERLAPELGAENVFLDLKTLEAGTKWLTEIEAHGKHGGAFIALIGQAWLAALENRKQVAPGDPQDYVVLELELALHRWTGKVIPVLVGRTTMPAAVKLPKPIRALAGIEALHLRPMSFAQDLDRLVGEIGASPGEPGRSREETTNGSPPPPDVAAARAGKKPRREAAPVPAAHEAISTTEPAVVPAPDQAHYECVLGRMVREGSIVPVLGSGVRGGLPDADQLAAHLVEKFQLELTSPDLAEVAQRVAVSEGGSFLDRAILEALTPRPEPHDMHRFLARFPGRLRDASLEERYQMIVTTNYDASLEQAFDDAGEEYDLAVFLATGTDSAGTDKGRFLHVPWQEEPRVISEPARYREFKIDRFDELERTLIVKINGAAEGGEGDLRWDGNYVLTEDQYIDYLASDQVARLVPYQILNKLTGSHCLFLGYQMRDWSLRVFLKRAWQGRQLTNTSWAVERRVDAWERDCWKGLNVEVLAASPDDYANALDVLLANWHPTPP
ncbi:MAG TPA: SIR2 family protein [Solirubrobacteraceae bacterium]|nr:SIR2 family protein [Solirubrobacteraceae bacterium]